MRKFAVLLIAAVIGWSSGASATTLQLWFRADVGVTAVDNSGSGGGENDVSAWADQSGRGSNVGQTTSAMRPEFVANGLNGNPVVRFSCCGSQADWLTGSLASAVDINRVTAFFVGSMTRALVHAIPIGAVLQLGQENVVWGSATAGPATDPVTPGYVPFAAGWGQISGKLNTLEAAGPVDSSPHVFWNTGDNLGQEMRISVDGVESAVSSDSSSSIPLQDATHIALGSGLHPFDARAFAGDVAEIMVFDDVLTSDQLTGMTHILGDRWGLTVPTASELQIASANALLPAAIPEPTTALLLTLGLAGLGMRRRVR